MFKEPGSLWTAYHEAQHDLGSLDDSDTITTFSLDIHSLIFLARHYDHDLWAECETGILCLGRPPKTYRGSALPTRFTRSPP